MTMVNRDLQSTCTRLIEDPPHASFTVTTQFMGLKRCDRDIDDIDDDSASPADVGQRPTKFRRLDATHRPRRCGSDRSLPLAALQRKTAATRRLTTTLTQCPTWRDPAWCSPGSPRRRTAERRSRPVSSGGASSCHRRGRASRDVVASSDRRRVTDHGVHRRSPRLYSPLQLPAATFSFRQRTFNKSSCQR